MTAIDTTNPFEAADVIDDTPRTEGINSVGIPEELTPSKGTLTALDADRLHDNALQAMEDYHAHKRNVLSENKEPDAESLATLQKLDAAAESAISDFKEARRIRKVQGLGEDLRADMNESSFEAAQRQYQTRMDYIATKAFNEGQEVSVIMNPPKLYTATRYTPKAQVREVVKNKRYEIDSIVGLPAGLPLSDFTAADSFAGTLANFASTTSAAPFITTPYAVYQHQMAYQGPMIRADVINMQYTDTTAPQEWPIISTEPAANTNTAEDANISDTDPTHGEVTIGTTQVDAWHEISNKLRKGSYVDIDGVVVEILRRAVGRSVNHHLTTATTARNQTGTTGLIREADQLYGTGTEPNQITLTRGTNLPARAVDTLKTAYGRLDDGFDIPNETGWMTHRRTASAFDSVSSANTYDLAPWYAQANYSTHDASMGIWGHWLGCPVWTNPAMTPAPNNTASEVVALFGNYKGYTVRMCPIEVFLSEHAAAQKNNLAIRVVTYVGGKRTMAAGIEGVTGRNDQLGPWIVLKNTA